MLDYPAPFGNGKSYIFAAEIIYLHTPRGVGNSNRRLHAARKQTKPQHPTGSGQGTGSLGAAALATVGTGLWEGFDRIDEIHQVQYTATPQDKHVPG